MRRNAVVGIVKSTGGAGGAEANSSEVESTGAGGGAESFGCGAAGDWQSQLTHTQVIALASGFDVAASTQHRIVQFAQHAGAALGFSAGEATNWQGLFEARDWLGHAHAFAGSMPVAVETASNTQTTGR